MKNLAWSENRYSLVRQIFYTLSYVSRGDLFRIIIDTKGIFFKFYIVRLSFFSLLSSSLYTCIFEIRTLKLKVGILNVWY